MAKSFRGGKALHDLAENAPVQALLEFLAHHQIEVDFEAGSEHEQRKQIIEALRALNVDQILPAKDAAPRIVPFGEQRNGWIITRSVEKRVAAEQRREFEAGDELGRAIWAYLNCRAAFDDAEAILHAVDQRSWGKSYSSFEVAGAAPSRFDWSDDVEATLRDRIVEKLDLKENCSVTHLLAEGEPGAKEPTHIMIVRFGGQRSSVAEYRDEGIKGRHYYRRPDEVTLLYKASTRTIEVSAESPAARFEVGSAFAEAGLGQDLSAKPLLFKHYDLSRFYENLSVEHVEPEGFSVQAAGLVEITVLAGSTKRRVSLRVPAEEDIGETADRLFGPANVFRRASGIARLVFSVTYWPKGSDATKSFRFDVGYPNRSNLPGRPDEEQRGLGYALLEAWGVLKPLRIPDAVDFRGMLPALLELYDQPDDIVPETWFTTRNLDADRLISAAFIVPRGRFEDAVIDEDDDAVTTPLSPSANAGAVRYEDHTGRMTFAPGALSRKFAIERRWIEEKVQGALGPQLTPRQIRYLHPRLALLGDLAVGERKVPCYLARGLGDVRTLKELDIHLQGHESGEAGILFAAARDAPLVLGRNVVVPLVNCLGPANSGRLLDAEAVNTSYSENRRRSMGLAPIELREGPGGSATLIMPRRPPWTIGGEQQTIIIRRLVDAYRSGSPAVPTKHLLRGTGMKSPRQAFGPKQRPDFDERVENAPPRFSGSFGRAPSHHEVPPSNPDLTFGGTTFSNPDGHWRGSSNERSYP